MFLVWNGTNAQSRIYSTRLRSVFGGFAKTKNVMNYPFYESCQSVPVYKQRSYTHEDLPILQSESLMHRFDSHLLRRLHTLSMPVQSVSTKHSGHSASSKTTLPLIHVIGSLMPPCTKMTTNPIINNIIQKAKYCCMNEMFLSIVMQLEYTLFKYYVWLFLVKMAEVYL